MKSALRDRRVLLGVAFILLGTFLLLNNLGWIPYFFPDYLFSWKTLLILGGLFALGNRENKTPGIVLIAIGTYFLLPEIFDISLRDVWAFWPLLLVVIGLFFIFRKDFTLHQPVRDSQTNSMDYLDEVAVFGGIERTVLSGNFQGGRITSVCGGVEINLLNASLAAGKNVIDVFAVFGGITLIIPADWRVKTEVATIFGGFNDERKFLTEPSLEVEKGLYIKGFVVFGGGELKSVRVR